MLLLRPSVRSSITIFGPATKLRSDQGAVIFARSSVRAQILNYIKLRATDQLLEKAYPPAATINLPPTLRNFFSHWLYCLGKKYL